MDWIDGGRVHDDLFRAAAGAGWQRKSARDISLTMFLLFSFGVACWLVYGIDSGPITAANAITLALALAILALKLRYDRTP